MVIPSDSSIGLPLTTTVMKKPHRGGCGLVEQSLRARVPFAGIIQSRFEGSRAAPGSQETSPRDASALYPSFELTGEVVGRGHRQLADVAPAQIRGRLSVYRAPLGQQGYPGRCAPIFRSAGHDLARQVASEHFPEQRPCARLIGRGGPDERNLRRRPEMKIERTEIAAEARWMASHEIGHRTEHFERERLELLLAEIERETEQPLRGRRGAGRNGVVVEVPWSHDQRLLVDARVEEHVALAVPEQADRFPRETEGLVEPAAVKSRLVERHEPDAHQRVGLEVCLDPCPPV